MPPRRRRITALPTVQPCGQNGGMTNRSRDWLAQAQHDLEHAEFSRRRGDHGWACFAAHQAAEKAAKAAHLAEGQDAWGHVVRELLAALPDLDRPGLLDGARVLDAHYIPTRYANGHPDGAPFEHYGEIQSEQAIAIAREIVAYCRTRRGADHDGSDP